MKVALTRQVKPPSKGTPLSAGYDFYIPTFDDIFIQDFIKYNETKNSVISKIDGMINVYPHSKVFIPSGIKLEVPKGFTLYFFNKSGVSFKQQLSFLANIIDEDYQGELFITLFNYSDDITSITQEQKLIQGVLLPTCTTSIEIVPISDIHKEKSERGSGGLGSTGV